MAGPSNIYSCSHKDVKRANGPVWNEPCMITRVAFTPHFQFHAGTYIWALLRGIVILFVHVQSNLSYAATHWRGKQWSCKIGVCGNLYSKWPPGIQKDTCMCPSYQYRGMHVYDKLNRHFLICSHNYGFVVLNDRVSICSYCMHEWIVEYGFSNLA